MCVCVGGGGGGGGGRGDQLHRILICFIALSFFCDMSFDILATSRHSENYVKFKDGFRSRQINSLFLFFVYQTLNHAKMF